jgi:hypothetical protein
MVPNVCSIVAICAWISTFASVCVRVVLLPSIFPPHQSFLLVTTHRNVQTVVKNLSAAGARIFYPD